MSEKTYKCPMYNQGICDIGMIPICKFNDEGCFVNPLTYSLFLQKNKFFGTNGERLE